MVRLFFFAAASAFFWPVLSITGALKFILQTSPFVAICTSVSLRQVEGGAAVGFAVALAAMFRRRWFCRYICPTGLLLEWAARIGPAKALWWEKLPHIGKYTALLTFFGAILGYPFLLWMDPLAIFSSFFSIRTAGTILSGFLAGIGLAVLFLIGLASGQLWCARLCPLGGAQDILISVKSLFRKKGAAPIEPKKEIMPMRRALLLGAAGIGIGFLARRAGAARGEDAPLRPPGAAAEDVFTGLCTRCGNCARACPSGIITPDSGQAGLWGLLAPVINYTRERNDFPYLRGLFDTMQRQVSLTYYRVRRAQPSLPRVKNPRASTGKSFHSRVYDKKYCLPDCVDCTMVCPSGALQRLDIERKRRYIIGEALIDHSLCLVTLGRKDCDACVAACPFGAVRIHWDDELYAAYPLIDMNNCNGCGACEVVCPVEGYKAIRVWKLENPG